MLLEAGGGIPCRPNPAATLLVKFYEANVTYRSPCIIAIPSVVCDVRAPYSEASTFRQYFAPRCSIGIWDDDCNQQVYSRCGLTLVEQKAVLRGDLHIFCTPTLSPNGASA